MARRFRGSEEVKVDAKGRVSIPAKFRRVFEASDPDFEPGKRAQLVIVFGTRDWKYLQLFTINAIDEIDEQIAGLDRGSPRRNYLEHIYHGHSEEAEIDGDGRLVLPQKLRDKIGLDDGAFFTSKGDFIEVWSPTNYSESSGSLQNFMAQFPDDFDPRSFLNVAADQDPREG